MMVKSATTSRETSGKSQHGFVDVYLCHTSFTCKQKLAYTVICTDRLTPAMNRKLIKERHH